MESLLACTRKIAEDMPGAPVLCQCIQGIVGTNVCNSDELQWCQRRYPCLMFLVQGNDGNVYETTYSGGQAMPAACVTPDHATSRRSVSRP